MVKKYCDLCGAEIAETRPAEIHSNLWLYMGDYSVKIDIAKAGLVTDLCRVCRVKIVTNALAQSDPYFGLILSGDNQAAKTRKTMERKQSSLVSE